MSIDQLKLRHYMSIANTKTVATSTTFKNTAWQVKYQLKLNINVTTRFVGLLKPDSFYILFNIGP